MNVLEASTLIDTCIGLGIWPNTTPDLLADQSQIWADQLDDVPLEWAVNFAHAHPGPYSLRPSQIRGAWAEYRKREQRNQQGYNERACAFQRRCRCSHAAGVCMRGFVDTPREWSTEKRGETTTPDGDTVTIVRDVIRDSFCPACWDARNAVRQEKGLDPIDLGVIGPRV